ncbi:FtsX-like permease family protein [Candidatus Woesearchaeota archaeon]|nr:FtsX-like permease family protein [Candidatus Woesearchaeota archaeon]
MKDYITYVLNNLKHRRVRSWLTMIGIFIGIASVVALIGLGEGLRNAINSQFGFLGTDILTITASGGFGAPGTGVIDPLTDKELEAVRDVPGIDHAAGRILESTSIIYNDISTFSFAASMPDGEDRKLVEDLLSMEAEKGRLLRDGDKYAVFIGYNFLEEDNAFGKPLTPGKNILIQGQEFEVKGVMKKKGNFQLDQLIVINDKVMRDLFGRKKDEYDLMAARFDQNAEVDKIKQDIEKEFRKIRDVEEGEEDFSVDTPQSTLESVNNILLGVQIFIYIIAGISILVGGIGIMNTMYTAVVERTKEIGIMKSIGARNPTIFSLFFIESGFLGAVGGAIGALLGYIIAKGLAYIGKLAFGSALISARISPFLMIGAVLFSFIVGSFFGTLPAIQASKLNPVDAIRSAK